LSWPRRGLPTRGSGPCRRRCPRTRPGNGACRAGSAGRGRAARRGGWSPAGWRPHRRRGLRVIPPSPSVYARQRPGYRSLAPGTRYPTPSAQRASRFPTEDSRSRSAARHGGAGTGGVCLARAECRAAVKRR
jgi:hypothetical protein